MPSALTHLNLGIKVSKYIGNIDFGDFILGTIAPDCINFNDEVQYVKSHFINADGQISMSKFLESNKRT